MAAVAPTQEAQLKKLGFVPEISSQAATRIGAAYTTAKAYVPASLKPQLERAEVTVSSVSAPYIAKAQDVGSEMLKTVDEKVTNLSAAGALLKVPSQLSERPRPVLPSCRRWTPR